MGLNLLERFAPPGQMAVAPEKISYSVGETIRGKLVLTTQKPINATELVVRLFANETKRNAKGQNETRNIFTFETPLVKGPKDFVTGEFPFEIKVPQIGGAPANPIGGTAGAVLGAVLSAASGFKVVDWYLEGDLKISGGRDVAQKVRLNIG